MTEIVNAGIVPYDYTNVNWLRISDFKKRTDNYLNLMQCPDKNNTNPVSECQDLLNYGALYNYFNNNCVDRAYC